MRELEATGIIESEPHRGSRVRTVSERELGEAYQVRAVLEQLAGEFARTQRKDADFAQPVRALLPIRRMASMQVLSSSQEDTYLEPVPFRRPRVATNNLVRGAAIDKGIRSVVI